MNSFSLSKSIETSDKVEDRSHWHEVFSIILSTINSDKKQTRLIHKNLKFQDWSPAQCQVYWLDSRFVTIYRHE